MTKTGSNSHKVSDASTRVEKHTTPDGRVIYDILSLIRSPEAKKHFERLDRLADKGLIPKPLPITP